MCTSPNFMQFVGYEWTGQPIWKFLGKKDSVKYDEFIKSIGGLSNNTNLIQVPCGQCEDCRAERARHWAERCALEAKNSKYNYFITLTYADDYVPKEGLVKSHLQDFMKRVRKIFPKSKIRFFGCGEYGSKTFRPHFHVLLFNCPIDDLSERFMEEKDGRLIIHSRGDLDLRCMYSNKIHGAWSFYDHKKKESHRFGNIAVASFSFATACYVSQYVTKKSSKELKKFYKMFSCNPEYIAMSRRPGIGGSQFDKADFENDCIIVPGDGKAHVSSIPRYFDKLIIKQKGEDWFNKNIRSRRIVKRIVRQKGLELKGYSYDREFFVKSQRYKKLKTERQSL